MLLLLLVKSPWEQQNLNIAAAHNLDHGLLEQRRQAQQRRQAAAGLCSFVRLGAQSTIKVLS
jgi:hypothetical protein